MRLLQTPTCLLFCILKNQHLKIKACGGSYTDFKATWLSSGEGFESKGAPESSSARARGKMEQPTPSRRPQHEHQTPAPNRRSPPPQDDQWGQATLPPHWNHWSRRQDYPARPRRTQHNGGIMTLHTSGGLLEPHLPQQVEPKYKGNRSKTHLLRLHDRLLQHFKFHHGFYLHPRGTSASARGVEGTAMRCTASLRS